MASSCRQGRREILKASLSTPPAIPVLQREAGYASIQSRFRTGLPQSAGQIRTTTDTSVHHSVEKEDDEEDDPRTALQQECDGREYLEGKGQGK